MKRYLIGLGLVCLSQAVWSHTGHHVENSFLAGFWHPLSGWDHLLAMWSAGIWISYLPTSARWKTGGLFVLGMIASALGASALGTLPGVELAIVLSVTLLGIVLLTRLQLSATPAGLLLMAFGAFHGYAHGLEAPLTHLTPYIAGFSLTSAGLIAIGCLTGIQLPRHQIREKILRVLGAGLVLISGSWLFT